MGREIKIELGTNLDEVVRILREYKEKGEDVWCLFYDYKFTSFDSLDVIYKKVFGFSKVTYDKKRRSFEQEYLESEEKRKLMIMYNKNFWIKEGKKVIVPEKHAEWEKCVCSFIDSECVEFEIDDALDIMYELESGSSLEDVIDIFVSQEHSGNSAFIVRNLVYIFSKRGKEFIDYFSKNNIYGNGNVKKLVK